ncbi:hypothetical protein NDN08_008293 [Rhodosorus marinus]|uniref:Glycine--tRNA ligase n=1 Tax=Rhodosorus marinus TaxID=101924 RepID=A0AAV8V1Q9_9RHOD|nr:hypothetical protein NDN08_008293 [Rhodosorus marinus]
MDENNLNEEIDRLSNELLEKSDLLRSMRRGEAERCDSASIASAKTEVKDLNRRLGSMLRRRDAGVKKDEGVFDRVGTESLMKRRFFVTPSFEIYGGIAGLYDYGPPGCSVKSNLVQVWKNHFVVQESMLEIEGTCLTPEPVLKASGHVDRFTDLMVKDTETQECYRADHILKAQLEKIIDDPATAEDRKEDAEGVLAVLDELDADDMDEAIASWDVKATETGNKLSAAFPFNLMFGTQIGPSGLVKGFLRPETAQGIFVNFKRLLDFNRSRLPFACAQIGLSFRNEISPRAGLLRVREFMQAEIEHFVHPQKKNHAKFDSVKDYSLALFPRRQQLTTRTTVQMTIGEAVANGIIDNETLAFYIARTSMFCEKVGLNKEHIRFREHLENEMAHYATECWDLEVNCSHGWIECAGLADRSCYDLQSHSESSKIELSAREIYSEVKSVEFLKALPQKGVMGKAFKKDAQLVMKALEAMSEDEVAGTQSQFDSGAESVSVKVADGRSFSVTKDMISYEKGIKKESGRNYYPSVIEPSFGVGRILYCIFEHSYYVREGDDEARGVLRFPPIVAPIKAAVLPLSKNEVFNPIAARVGEALGACGLIYRIDDTGASIGKRYARFDELGTPFGITVDFDSVNDSTVTLRDRDSMRQVRGDIDGIVQSIFSMVSGTASWGDVEKIFPPFSAAEE